jgi:hypothetical protein
MAGLTHYIVVRRDLPFGVVAAQIAHAAGESFYAFALPKVTFTHTTMPGSRPGPGTTTMASGGYMPPMSLETEPRPFRLPASGAPFVASETIAIVLGARNEGKLARLELELAGAAIPHVAIREVDGEYAGQLMAIGLLPGEKDALAPWVHDFHMLPRLA